MATITIHLTGDRFRKLQEIAQQVHSTPQRVLQANIADWLDRTQEEFARAAKYVLRKNADLYRRLA